MLTSALQALRLPVGGSDPACLGSDVRAELTTALFAESSACQDPEARRALLHEIVTLNITVADSIAHRYAGRGIAAEDLRQEARLALVRAADAFEVSLGSSFLAYAVPCIVGTLRKQFRDQGWAVRPPRRVQEAHQAINRARPELAQELGREPTITELAERTGVEQDTVVEALASAESYTAVSLDAPIPSRDAGAADFGSLFGELDPEFGRTELRLALAPLVAGLSERDQTVLHLRFVEGLTQREVGEQIGVSQMQVSRILTRIYSTLRQGLADGAAAPAA
jgi:RNA polymerase sigma-B factor